MVSITLGQYGSTPINSFLTVSIPQRFTGRWGIDKLPNHVILKTKGGAAGRREPLNIAQEVNVERARLRRLLLFIVNLQEQVNDTNDQNSNLDQIRISDHLHHLLPTMQEENKKYVAPPEKEGPRLPNYGQRQRISTRQIYYSIL